MRCQNSPDIYRRCQRSATKIAILKDVFGEQSGFWICDECFNEKLFSDKLFKDHLIQVVELQIKK